MVRSGLGRGEGAVVRSGLGRGEGAVLRRPSPAFRCRGPDFLGIGAQKAGTSWLYENLKRHPDISFPAGKEVHFWDRRGDRAAAVWLDLFPAGEGRKQGEITPAYGILDSEAIREIGELCPAIRLFYSVRNPIERAWSAALMVLERAKMTLDATSERWFINHFASDASRRRGDAALCLATWRSVFPAGQLHAILFDDIVQSPHDTLVKLAGHIGVDGEFFRTVPEKQLKRPVGAGPGHPLPAGLRRFLTDFYGGQIARLEELLNRDLRHWLGD